MRDAEAVFLVTHPADVNMVPKEQEELLEFEFGGDKSYSDLSSG